MRNARKLRCCDPDFFDDYRLKVKQAVCVGCKSTKDLVRFKVVPAAFKKYFPTKVLIGLP